MRAHTILVSLAIAALVACAHARPGNDIEPTHTNEISSKEVDSSKSSPELSEQKSQEVKPATSSASSESVVIDAVITSTEAEKSDVSAPVVAKAVNEQFPHAVLFSGTCGGTIISPTWILTAGHCTIFSSGYFSVLAGTNKTDDGSGIYREVKRLVIHPRFSVGPYWLDAEEFGMKQVAADWDYLLAELKDPLPLDGKTLAAAELDDGDSIPEGLEVGYAGFGAARHGETMRHSMHAMELAVQPNSRCETTMPDHFRAETMVCTQGRPPRLDSACNGDSGSGLVANGKVYGIASWVENDALRCYNGALVVFSRVAAARDWIRQVTGV